MSTTRLVSPALARAVERGSLVRVGDERLVVERVDLARGAVDVRPATWFDALRAWVVLDVAPAVRLAVRDLRRWLALTAIGRWLAPTRFGRWCRGRDATRPDR